MHPWAIKNQLPGATICCQNAPVSIHHKDIINYRNSYICCELSFGSYLTCFHNKYQRKSVLCVLTFLCSGNVELYFVNCPMFMPIPLKQAQFWNANCPWFLLAYFKAWPQWHTIKIETVILCWNGITCCITHDSLDISATEFLTCEEIEWNWNEGYNWKQSVQLHAMHDAVHQVLSANLPFTTLCFDS